MRREGLVVARSCRVWEALSGGWVSSPGKGQAALSTMQAHGFPPTSDYTWSWEQHLQLGVAAACMVILVVCVSCYFSIIK